MINCASCIFKFYNFIPSTMATRMPVFKFYIISFRNRAKWVMCVMAITATTTAVADTPADSTENVKTLQVVVVNGGESDA